MDKNDKLSDADLLSRFRQHGELDDFWELAQRHMGALYGTVLSVLGRGGEDAWSFVHDAILRALEKIHQARDAQSFRGWLCKIGENTVRNAARRQRRLVPMGGLQNGDTHGEYELPDPGPDPYEILEKVSTEKRWRELFQLFQQFKGVLTRDGKSVDRRVLELYIEGCTSDEIAILTGLSSPGAVRARVTRLRRKFKAFVEKAERTSAQETAHRNNLNEV